MILQFETARHREIDETKNSLMKLLHWKTVGHDTEQPVKGFYIALSGPLEKSFHAYFHTYYLPSGKMKCYV